MPHKDRMPDRAMVQARLEEGKRALDAMLVKQREHEARFSDDNATQLRDLEERHQALVEQAEGAFAGAEDKVASLAHDLDELIEDWERKIKAFLYNIPE